MRDFEKVIHPGRGRDGEVFCKIKFADGRLSITGVEGPMKNGNARGGCGQITIDPSVIEPARGWTPNLIGAFRAIWEAWHLNDMRAGCEHQRASWNLLEPLEVLTYELTAEAHKLKREAEREASAAALAGRVAQLTPAGRFLIGPAWFLSLHQAPDADSPQSGLYEVKRRETRPACHVTTDEHPKGCLSKPCEVCGYKYGSAWLREDVPGDVLAFLAELPDTDVPPAWV